MNTPFWKTIFVFTISCFICLFNQSSPAAATNKTVVVAIDLSSSTLSHRTDYVKYFRMILDTMGGQDTLLVTRITSNPSAGESLAFAAVQYEEISMLKNRNRTKEENLRRSLDALHRFETLSRETVEETPILEVTENCVRLFSKFPADRYVIVYLSDMMEHSAATSFERSKPPFSEKAASAAFEKITNEKRIADLHGVKVYVAGARDENPLRLKAVKWFWESYFRTAGAYLDPNNYGPDLISFDECNTPGECGSIFKDGRDKKLR